MSRSTTHRTSEAEVDGKLAHVVVGGLVSANATTRFLRWVAPCDCKFKQADLGVIVTPTNAAAVLRIGVYTDTDYFFDDKNIQNRALGSADILSDALFLVKDVNKGDIIVAEFTNADTTGELALTLVFEPR